MFERDVVPGVHRIEHASTNCYLVESDDSFTLIDAGLPGTWPHLENALGSLGASINDIDMVALTHGHFDHIGMVKRLHDGTDVKIWVHQADAPIVKDPSAYEPGRPRWVYPITYPRSIPHLARMASAGALHVPGMTPHTFHDGDDAPFSMRVTTIPVTGHTAGSCAFLLTDRDAIVTGDALVTCDPYTGRTGPRLVAQGGTQNAPEAVRSLDHLQSTGVRNALPGHGSVWADGIGPACDHARKQTVP